jgi:hypothetical protein
MTFNPVNAKNAFLQTTENFPEDNSQFLVKLNSSYSDIAQAVNIREIAQYDLQEIITGQQFSTVGNPQKKRYSFRKIFYFGAIVAGATLLIPHGLTLADITLFTHIGGGLVITPGVDYRPLPYVSTIGVNDQVLVFVRNANIEVTLGAIHPNVTSGLVVLEYLKN